MSYIGIDLGTTFSVVAYYDSLVERSKIIEDRSVALVASRVNVRDNKLLVGDGRDVGTGGNAELFKRYMGDPDKVYSLGGEEYTPTQLSTAVLKHMKGMAEAQIDKIGEAVVTVPANFSHEARDATMVAAKEAGLDVKYIVNEPTAAALYYASVGKGDLSGKYAVYDLGGGTFDVTIMDVQGYEVDVIRSDGVRKLGGHDFDKALMGLVKEKYQAEAGKALDLDQRAMFDLEDEVTKAKHELSEQEETQIFIKREQLTVTRAEFEEAISSLIAQAEMLCESLLEEIGLKPSDLEAVFLAGGSTRIPAVRRSVESVFKQAGTSTVDVDKVVALGAALYAAHKAGEGGDIEVSESTALHFGTIALGVDASSDRPEEINDILIERGAKIPTSVTREYYTVAHGQTQVACEVTESRTEESNPKFVTKVAERDLEVPPDRPAGQVIEVTFSYTENQMLHASFKDVASGETVELHISKSGDDTIDGVEKHTV